MSIRIGSLCSGYRGLDMAIEQVFGGTTAWVSDIDAGANKILAHHWPTTPNIGDLTTAKWEDVEPVDILCGGYPCQPFSIAGTRKGTADERHLWPFIAGALRVLRPRYAIFENVANHLRVGFDTVLRDLADLGFDVEWCVVRADEVGAPHQRRRLFILATAPDADGAGLEGRGVRGAVAELGRAAEDADRAARNQWGLAAPGQEEGGSARSDVGGRGGTSAADAQRLGCQGQRGDAGTDEEGPSSPSVGCGSTGGGQAASDSAGERRGEGRPKPEGQQGRPGVALGGGAASAHPASSCREDGPVGDRAVQFVTESGAGGGVGERRDAEGTGESGEGASVLEWRQFAPAVARWEAATGRRAPWATDDRGRLSPAFVEWMMGLPAGHVTAVPELTRTQQLKALGNGVVPQQAAAALRLLADRAGLAVVS